MPNDARPPVRVVAADQFARVLGPGRRPHDSGRFDALGPRAGQLRSLLDHAAQTPAATLRTARLDPDVSAELRNAQAFLAVQRTSRGETAVLAAIYPHITALLQPHGLTSMSDAARMLRSAACAIATWDTMLAARPDGALYALRMLTWDTDRLLAISVEQWLTGHAPPPSSWP